MRRKKPINPLKLPVPPQSKIIRKNDNTIIEQNTKRPRTPNELNHRYPDLYKQVELLSQLGATDIQLAMFFGVTPDCITKRMRKDPKFHEARKKGGIIADTMVADRLYQRALGYDFTETEYRLMTNPDTKQKEMIAVKRIIKHIPPDTGAMIYWVKTRQRALWGDVYTVEHTGTINHKLIQDMPVDVFAEDELEFLFKIGAKQLGDQNASSN
jgi:hypothetical protein